METHRLHEELLKREVRVLVVGCSGTGSSILGGLPYLHQAMLVQGHPYGLSVTVMDGDTVSPFNCVRQPFSRSEIGLNCTDRPGDDQRRVMQELCPSRPGRQECQPYREGHGISGQGLRARAETH